MLKVHIPRFSLPGFREVPRRGSSKARKDWEREALIALHTVLTSKLGRYFDGGTTISEKVGMFVAQYHTLDVATESYTHFYPLGQVVEPSNMDLESKKVPSIDVHELLKDPELQDQEYRVETLTKFTSEDEIKFLVPGRKKNLGYNAVVVGLMESLLGKQTEGGPEGKDFFQFPSTGIPKIQFDVRNKPWDQIYLIARAYAEFVRWANGNSAIQKVVLDYDMVNVNERDIHFYRSSNPKYPGLQEQQSRIDETKATIDAVVKDELRKEPVVRRFYEALQKNP